MSKFIQIVATKSPPSTIEYSFYTTQFGSTLIGSANQAICYIGFAETINDLTTRFSNSKCLEQQTPVQLQAIAAIKHTTNSATLPLYIHGTPFQLAVWQVLLQIPFGSTASYKQIATFIGMPNAVRAVGTAIGKNPITYLIPCHRVITSTGAIGNYHWGSSTKQHILTYEQKNSPQ